MQHFIKIFRDAVAFAVANPNDAIARAAKWQAVVDQAFDDVVKDVAHHVNHIPEQHQFRRQWAADVKAAAAMDWHRRQDMIAAQVRPVPADAPWFVANAVIKQHVVDAAQHVAMFDADPAVRKRAQVIHDKWKANIPHPNVIAKIKANWAAMQPDA